MITFRGALDDDDNPGSSGSGYEAWPTINSLDEPGLCIDLTDRGQGQSSGFPVARLISGVSLEPAKISPHFIFFKRAGSILVYCGS